MEEIDTKEPDVKKELKEHQDKMKKLEVDMKEAQKKVDNLKELE